MERDELSAQRARTAVKSGLRREHASRVDPATPGSLCCNAGRTTTAARTVHPYSSVLRAGEPGAEPAKAGMKRRVSRYQKRFAECQAYGTQQAHSTLVLRDLRWDAPEVTPPRYEYVRPRRVRGSGSNPVRLSNEIRQRENQAVSILRGQIQWRKRFSIRKNRVCRIPVLEGGEHIKLDPGRVLRNSQAKIDVLRGQAGTWAGARGTWPIVPDKVSDCGRAPTSTAPRSNSNSNAWRTLCSDPLGRRWTLAARTDGTLFERVHRFRPVDDAPIAP
jgi:hypothetical protein